MPFSFSRRSFLEAAAALVGTTRARLRSLAQWGNFTVNSAAALPEGNSRLFPPDLPDSRWQNFHAAGYAKPVSGVIYRNAPTDGYGPKGVPRPVSGMPLGGIDTGGLSVEGYGTFGYSSIFNHYVPPGGPLNAPFLGIGISGQTHVLTTNQNKNYAANNRPSVGPNLVLTGILAQTKCAKSIDYWGHYPIADLHYKTDLPVEVSLRAWSPFIPGDTKTSNTPGAVFEIHLANRASTQQAGTLAFSFPGFAEHRTRDMEDLSGEVKLPPPQIDRRQVASAGLTGVCVEDKGWGMSYVLAALEEPQVRMGGGLGSRSEKWSQIEKVLPETSSNDGGSSLALDWKLEPGQEKVVRVILAWYAPEWEANGNPGTGGHAIRGASGKRFTHIYASRFANAREVAEFLARNHPSLLARIIAWQSEIYNDRDLPGWLADSLVNSFYYYAPCSLWAQAKPPVGAWCKPEDGLFAMCEAPRSCPTVSPLPNIAQFGPWMVYFFPDLALSIMRSYKSMQKENGDVACIPGKWADPYTPMHYGYQQVMNGANYMLQLHRYWMVTRDRRFLEEFYASGKQAMEYSFNRRPDLGMSQIIAMPPADPDSWNEIEWFEDRHIMGYVAHPGGYRMAAAGMMREWAAEMGDTDQVKKLDALLAAGKDAMQKDLWRGDHYLVYNDTGTGKTLDLFFPAQLNGQFWARLHGVPAVIPRQNAAAMLRAIREKVCNISRLGIPPNFANPDGTPYTGEANHYMTGKYTFNETQVIYTALTFAYEGQREFGLELLHRLCENNACRWGYMWDSPCCHSAFDDDGEGTYGWDYWFNACIWAAPAALANQDLTGPCKPGGLVDRILKAGAVAKG